MIPAVDGLLPEPYNTMLLTLLFRLAEWHALAKLRMHTESTLNALEQATITIGKELRSFRDWTRQFRTVELPGEVAARRRRRHKQTTTKEIPSTAGQSTKPCNLSITLPANSSPSLAGHGTHLSETTNIHNLPLPPSNSLPSPGTGNGTTSVPDVLSEQPKCRLFNLLTYKLHALGDYVRTIRFFGITDSYSTQIVSSPTCPCLLVFDYHRVSLHIALSNTSIGRPTREMQSNKLQNMSDVLSACAVQRKLQLHLEGDIATMFLSVKVTHFHIVQLTYITI